MDNFLQALPIWSLVALFPVFFAGVWCLVTAILAASGGWLSLSGYYAFSGDIPKPVKRLLYAKVRRRRLFPINYNNCVKLSADQDYLYVHISRFFRLFHSPLRIPFADIVATPSTFLRIKYVILSFEPKTSIQIVIRPQDWDWVQQTRQDTQ